MQKLMFSGTEHELWKTEIAEQNVHSHKAGFVLWGSYLRLSSLRLFVANQINSLASGECERGRDPKPSLLFTRNPF